VNTAINTPEKEFKEDDNQYSIPNTKGIIIKATIGENPFLSPNKRQPTLKRISG
jgi:hypothetical protein